MRRIDGLSTFMEYYGLSIYSVVLFDYYGDGLFGVKAFKANGIECNYPKTIARDFIRDVKNQNSGNEDSTVCHSTLDSEKQCALWSFNAFWNCSEYESVRLRSSDIRNLV